MNFFKHSPKRKLSILHITRIATFAAISFILGKFLQIPVGDSIRLSFENLPLLLCGYLYGPLAGGICGILADIIGCLLRGYMINPIITLGAASIGIFSGLFGLRGILPRENLYLSVTLSHIIGSMIIKSIGLWVFYQTPIKVLFIIRPITYIIIGSLEVLIIKLILKNKALKSLLENI